jgi:predicted GIY-YIG superfamily endonuclease
VYYEAYEYKNDALAREKRLKYHARGLIELKNV